MSLKYSLRCLRMSEWAYKMRLRNTNGSWSASRSTCELEVVLDSVRDRGQVWLIRFEVDAEADDRLVSSPYSRQTNRTSPVFLLSKEFASPLSRSEGTTCKPSLRGSTAEPSGSLIWRVRVKASCSETSGLLRISLRGRISYSEPKKKEVNSVSFQCVCRS